MTTVFGPPTKPVEWVHTNDGYAPDTSPDYEHGIKALPEMQLTFNGITISVVQGSGAAVGTGCVVSAGVQSFVSHVASEYKSLSGRRVLELGSGVGAAGIAMAAMGAQAVLTDVAQNPRPELRRSLTSPSLFENLLNVLEHNVCRNAEIIAASHGSARVMELLWGNKEHMQQIQHAAEGSLDIVIACNVTYDTSSYPVFLDTVKAFSDGSTRIFIANTSVLGDISLLVRMAQRVGLHCVKKMVADETDILEMARREF
eukprot:TRINITY_DN94874_c0_g1_i1.p1 TRINITY_DN94874_c0_g1~~TRINITY_DN94874_c0_g1_i1.p1  ORF type:complete len:257 (+),score=36.84 TRINITY_DN94874_c0_g1_i1:36-806(+)